MHAPIENLLFWVLHALKFDLAAFSSKSSSFISKRKMLKKFMLTFCTKNDVQKEQNANALLFTLQHFLFNNSATTTEKSKSKPECIRRHAHVCKSECIFTFYIVNLTYCIDSISVAVCVCSNYTKNCSASFTRH